MGNYGDGGGSGGGFVDAGHSAVADSSVTSDNSAAVDSSVEPIVYSGTDSGVDLTNNAVAPTLSEAESPEFFHQDSYEVVNKVDSAKLINMAPNHNLTTEVVVVPEGYSNKSSDVAADVNFGNIAQSSVLSSNSFKKSKEDEYVESVDDEIEIESILLKSMKQK